MANLVFRTSSTTAGGTANATSLGGRPSGTGPSTSSNGFFSGVTQAENDNATAEYRALFVYNPGTTEYNNVRVSVANKSGGGTVSVAIDSSAIAAFASYTSSVIASGTTAPTITGSWTSGVTIGTLLAGQVKVVWLKQVANRGSAQSADYVDVTWSGLELV